MRKIKDQVIPGQIQDTKVNDSEETSNYEQNNKRDSSELETGQEEDTRISSFGRKIKKPCYLNEYVFSIFRMAKTKQTERKSQTLCPICKLIINDDKYVEHMLLCKKEINLLYKM